MERNAGWQLDKQWQPRSPGEFLVTGPVSWTAMLQRMQQVKELGCCFCLPVSSTAISISYLDDKPWHCQVPTLPLGASAGKLTNAEPALHVAESQHT